ncbi:AAA family ATPase [Halegenticoccus soli]|uniref:AAA family ATPase n=1 Tax=Halegenticoccus soli TaxID=1985678 RepID=UPI000C6CBDAE|nr:AAA family ATPase [Halegenticoccus soli]
MRVIGTVGLPGSGKGEAARVAREEGIPVVTMGDVIRRECRDRGLDPAEHHGRVARALREENGPDAIAARSLPLVEDSLDSSDTVLVDGIRSGVEVDRFEEAFGDDFLLVSIEAPFDLRADRVTERGRDKPAEDGGEALRRRDERELGFGMRDAMDRADVVIENTDTLEAFRSRVREIIRTEAGTADGGRSTSAGVER